MASPYKGANVAHFYVPELEQGVTPGNPSWLPLRNTGGIPALTKDALVSNELDGSRETSSIRTGNEQVSGEFSIELSQESQDGLLAGAMTSDWVAGETHAAMVVSVDPVAKTFTIGDEQSPGVEVGQLIQFKGLEGDNAKPFIVTAVEGAVITGAGIQHELTAETDATADLVTADYLETGNKCKSFSVLTWMKGNCGTPDAFLITRGVEFSGFTIEQSVNAMVTGSFPFIGLSQEVLTSLPAGSTFDVAFGADPFASVDVSAYDGAAPLELIDSFTITNDNSASAQFALGNKHVAFVERGRAANTFSLSGKLVNLNFIDKFHKETQVELTSVLSGLQGAMSFTLKRARITAATPEVGGPESVTLSIEGQATGGPNMSSIVIQRIKY